jgi:hypothetical protein
MGKSALYHITLSTLQEAIPFKQLSLLFDRIYINNFPEIIKKVYLSKKNEIPQWQKLFENIDDIEYLQEIGIVSTFPSYVAYNESESEEQLRILKQASPEYLKSLTQGFATADSQAFKDRLKAESDGLIARTDAILLSKRHNIECIPVLSFFNGPEVKDKKEEVFQFILNDIPSPDYSTPWEQIIDFRSDRETRLKYLAMINWINEVAKSNFSANEIKERYEYLYYDYKRSYERHKIRTGFSTLEIITSLGVALTTGNIPVALNLVSSFLRIGTNFTKLLKEERDLPGKEIAYVFHTQNEFAD